MRRIALATVTVVALAVLTGGTTAARSDTAVAATAEVRTELDALVRAADVPGAQLVESAGDRDIRITSGVGDLGTGAPFPDTAAVGIASNTKAFVATVVLLLVGEGRIDLDAPVERYLPGVVSGPGGEGSRITVRNLLQHTSGIPDYLTRIELGSVDALRRSRSADALIRLGLNQPAAFEPGARAEYSNTNYLLAGRLVEAVTGVAIGAEVTRRILVPLNLRGTYWPLYPVENVIRGPHPRGYHQFGDTLVDITDIDPGWGLPDGAMVSTGADLNRFFRALLAGRILGPGQLEQMRATVPSGDPRRSDDFGLGLFRRTTSCGTEVWGHGGAMHGFFVYGAATPERAVTVSMNQLPDILNLHGAGIDPNAVVDTALCAP
ncbi:beta-lactamase family protein [Nocardia otitidiscaviarum]|uniref:serine hydrolase domain-containing protein n=1 Tax=Nocardia otitidiscaviarum TaxID=1823 RepID=UPI0018952F76|nr:serine hydrolase domain-containing protein [Nocardia otitidiscaviarum]MBF6239387.1 beta-lactamase family protein [Nocardia otitidiscaviarum]